jgi:hypothetical protein
MSIRIVSCWLALLIAIALLPNLAQAQSSFSEGFDSGFVEAWRQHRTSDGPGFTPAGRQETIDAIDAAEERSAAVRSAEREAWKNAARELREHGNTMYEIAESLRELREAYQALKNDRDVDPNYRPPGAPDIPVSCDGRGECAACYEKAQGEMNDVMVRFEKLRAIYGKNSTYIRKAIAFGDSTSGIHGVAGLAWQNQRKVIEAQQKRLDDAYDNKRPELMDALRESLEGIAQCEEQYFQNPDWYNRFAFMYYQFIDQKYQRQ